MTPDVIRLRSAVESRINLQSHYERDRAEDLAGE